MACEEKRLAKGKEGRERFIVVVFFFSPPADCFLADEHGVKYKVHNSYQL